MKGALTVCVESFFPSMSALLAPSEIHTERRRTAVWYCHTCDRLRSRWHPASLLDRSFRNVFGMEGKCGGTRVNYHARVFGEALQR